MHSNTSVILSGATAARAAGVAHVFSVREIYADFARFWPYYRRFLLTADALCCVSEATRAQFGGHPGRDVLHDGIGRVARAERATARRTARSPGRDIRLRGAGADLLLEGSGRLGSGPGRAGPGSGGGIGLVAGDPWPGQEHHQAAPGATWPATLSSAIACVCWVSAPIPATLYGAADVVVIPSTNPDPLPNVALEAAACGCCVVAADHGGLPEIIRDGQTGSAVPAGSTRGVGGGAG